MSYGDSPYQNVNAEVRILIPGTNAELNLKWLNRISLLAWTQPIKIIYLVAFYCVRHETNLYLNKFASNKIRL